MRYFEFVHNLGLHAWDIPALVALVILVIMIRSVYKELHADHETGAADNK